MKKNSSFIAEKGLAAAAPPVAVEDSAVASIDLAYNVSAPGDNLIQIMDVIEGGVHC